MSNTTNINITIEEAIVTLSNKVRKGWVSSVALMYQFKHEFSKEAIEAEYTKRINADTGEAFKKTKSTGTHTIVAKLALMERQDNGQWSVCNVQASRYAKACDFLQKNQIEPHEVKKFLADKKISEILGASKRGNFGKTGRVEDEAYKALLEKGLLVIENEFDDRADLEDFDLEPLGFEDPVSLAVVTRSDDGTYKVRRMTGKDSYDKLARDFVADLGEEATKAEAKAEEQADEAIEEAVAA